MRKSLRTLLALTAVLAAAAPAWVVGPAPANFTFDSGSGISNRFLTPNGDGLNDFVVFTFSNPRDSSVTGRIFDARGAEVARMSAGPALAFPSATLKWDGKAGGQAVPGGLYIYLISAEDRAFVGALVVVR